MVPSVFKKMRKYKTMRKSMMKRECRFCDYENSKKARLLKHISKCTKSKPENALIMDEEPLDLRSPLKLVDKNQKEVNTNNLKKNSQVESSEMRKLTMFKIQQWMMLP
jgi:hypothetical protein